MALLNLHPVRLLDGHTSGGTQLIFFRPEDIDRAVALLPELVSQARRWREELLPAGSLTMELSAVGQNGDAQNGVRAGLLLRVRLPEACAPAAIDEVCRKLGAAAVEWLSKRDIPCDAALSNDREGIVSLYPAAEPAHLFYLTKEGRAARTEDGPLHYFSSLRPMAALWTGKDALRAIRAGRGVSLHILPDAPDQVEQDAALKSALARTAPDSPCGEALKEITEDKSPCRVLFTVWGDRGRDGEELVQAVQKSLRARGVFLTARPVRDAGPAPLSQLVFDPWALYAWYKRQIGLKLASMAFTLTSRELSRLVPAAEKPEEKPETEPAKTPPAPSAAEQEEEIRRCVEKIGDEVLSRLLEKLNSVLPGGELLSAASDMLNRLDDLSRQNEQLHGQMDELDAIIRAQEAVYLRRMDAVESNLKETVETAAQTILAQLRANLERVIAGIAALPADLQGAVEAANKLEEALPSTSNRALTEQELQALGVKSTDELKEKGMTEEEIRLLTTALALARAGMEQPEEEGTFMPFAVPLGFLYELMVRNSFDKQVTPFDIQNQTAEYEAWLQMNPGRTRKRPPASKENTDLSFYDYLSYDRVVEGYFRHVFLDGKPLDDAREWNIWFACFKFVRAVRNKVHPTCGAVEKRELVSLYNLMILPGAANKRDAMRCLNGINAQGARDSSLVIRYAVEKYGQNRTEELFKYLSQPNEKSMEESVVQFLLRFRDTAEWKEMDC